MASQQDYKEMDWFRVTSAHYYCQGTTAMIQFPWNILWQAAYTYYTVIAGFALRNLFTDTDKYCF